MILVIDNYDSFVYNIVQYIGELGHDSIVYRNDKISIAQISKLKPSHIIISPGPCTPLEAGVSNDVIRYFAGKIPILGVCLGHQCIGYVYGGVIVQAKSIMHGKTSMIYHDGRGIFEGVENPFEATRYHSLAVRRDTVASCLEVSAWTIDGEAMGLRHKEFALEGVQFHPESILTRVGHDLLKNFLKLQRRGCYDEQSE